MITEQDLYLKILAYGLTDDASIAPPNVDVVNWYKFYSFCESQAILGIGLQCIDKLKKFGYRFKNFTGLIARVDRNN